MRCIEFSTRLLKVGAASSKHSQQASKKREFPYNNHLVIPVS